MYGDIPREDFDTFEDAFNGILRELTPAAGHTEAAKFVHTVCLPSLWTGNASIEQLSTWLEWAHEMTDLALALEVELPKIMGVD